MCAGGSLGGGGYAQSGRGRMRGSVRATHSTCARMRALLVRKRWLARATEALATPGCACACLQARPLRRGGRGARVHARAP
eukprot:2476617-Pleurochrysis_carterae.AAC.1